ncbi:MAG: nucleotide exchange factor GrpE, partial [Candidatus Magasanikbacteria bacterium CG10_big_fil_rev_8_21_14_0_10_38_6]
KNNFLEKVEVEKEKKPRFEFLREVEVASSEQKYLRALADYQNLLKQSAKERTEFVKFALEDFLHDLLPVYDHLKLSLKGLSEEEGKSAWVEGVRHVLKQFKKTLENRGIEEIKTEGEKFNHDEMEAIAGEGEKVKSEVMPGYKLNGKVIRVAKVIVE